MMHEKQEIRKQVADRLMGLTPEYAAAAAAGIVRVLLALPELISARCVSLYCAMAGEIDIGTVCPKLKRQGKEILLPRYNRAAGAYEMAKVGHLFTDTTEGYYGIREPVEEKPSVTRQVLQDGGTVWCIPGLAFDTAGHRIGHGGGYYDRLLKGTRGTKIGIAYDRQLFEAVPCEPHDVLMDIVVTEKRCVCCKQRAA